jgi:single-strand DNA-binding protein
MDLNKVMIIGRLTRDPELRATPGGLNVCNMGLATNFAYTNKQTGQKVEQVEFHNVTLFGKLGEIAAQYMKKGRRVYVEGRLQTRQWDAQDGTKKSRTDIIADNMIMLDGTPGGPGAPSGAPMGASSMSRPSSSPMGAGHDMPPIEELPTIQQDEAINVEDIPF